MFNAQTLQVQLPCALDAYDCINRIFVRWYQQKSPNDKLVLDIWVYAFAAQHIQYQYKKTGIPIEELNQVVAEIYLRVQADLERIKNPHRFTMWVTTICRRTLLNVIRNRHKSEPLEEALCISTVDQADQNLHVQMIRESLSCAIDELPDSLRTSAKLRYLDGYTPAEIANITNCPPERIHAYLGKIKTKLKKHVLLRETLYA